MAWTTPESPGIFFPNKKDEYCGNHHPGSKIEQMFFDMFSEYRHVRGDWKVFGYTLPSRNHYRFGRPHDCPAGSSADMAAQGYVGLYLLHDSTGTPSEYERERGAKDVLTPPELMEPAA